MIRVRTTLPDGVSVEERFVEDRVTIGRAPGNMMTVAASKVSSFHGQIHRRGQGLFYQDLRSTNGSLHVRGERRTPVDGVTTVEVTLEVGDRLLLGDLSEPVEVEIIALEAGEAEQGTVIAQRALRPEVGMSAIVSSRFANQARILDAVVDLLHGLTCEPDLRGTIRRIGGLILRLLPAAEGVWFQWVTTQAEPLVCVRRVSADQVELCDEPQRVLPVNLLERLERERQALLLEDLPRAVPSASVLRSGWRSVLAAPLFHEEHPVGALVVVARDGEAARFSTDDLDLCSLLATQTSAALYNAVLHERLRQAELRLREENRFLRESTQKGTSFEEIIGTSQAMKRVFETMQKVMSTDTTVLVMGETGTGKELVARALHDNGPRRERIFAAVNCGALTETLLESELFGHARGAFTGATNDKKGLFAVADRGTLFLDEIGEISATMQVKLLRAIQEGEITPVGATRPQRINVRIVCATNRRLEREVEAGRFRQDLYYRINVFPIELPPLRERRGDIALLAEHYLRDAAKKFGKSLRGFTPDALRCLESYSFPGNVRELVNEIERASLFAPDGGTVDSLHLSDRVQGGIPVPARVGKLKETMDELEKQVIVRALEQHDNNRSKTAVTLGISRQALQVKLARYGMVAVRED